MYTFYFRHNATAHLVAFRILYTQLPTHWEPPDGRDSCYCHSCFTVVIWTWTHNIFEVCLYNRNTSKKKKILWVPECRSEVHLHLKQDNHQMFLQHCLFPWYPHSASGQKKDEEGTKGHLWGLRRGSRKSVLCLVQGAGRGELERSWEKRCAPCDFSRTLGAHITIAAVSCHILSSQGLSKPPPGGLS